MKDSMKVKMNVLLVVLIGFISTATAQTSTTPVPGKALWVKASNPVVKVTLSANATTGYAWFIASYNHRWVRSVSAVYRPPVSTLIGAPGQSVWTFKISPSAFTAPHVITIKMLYMQPWNLHSAIKKTITLVTKTS
jgi:predicted secreted protein